MSVTEPHARQALQRLLSDYDALSAEDRALMNEASVVRQFIDRLLRDVLGWPIENPARRLRSHPGHVPARLPRYAGRLGEAGGAAGDV